MNFHWPFFTKPEPTDIPHRGLAGRFTTSPKTQRTQLRADTIRDQLENYVATISDTQRKADTEAYFAEAGRESAHG